MYQHSAITAVLMILAVLLAIPQACSQDNQLSPAAAELQHLHKLLKANPDNRVLQQRYLQQFPSDVDSFRRLFDPADFSELYDGYQHIFALKGLMRTHSLQTACLLINIAKHASWKEDAFNYLQEVTAILALDHTAEFAEVIRTFDPVEQEGVVLFLADGIHSPVKGYTEIIERLQQCGEDSLAARMVRVANQRSKTHAED